MFAQALGRSSVDKNRINEQDYSSEPTSGNAPEARLIRAQNGQMIKASGGFSLAHVEPESLEQIQTAGVGPSAFFTAELVEKAFNLIEPAIMSVLRQPDSPRVALHVCVLDPRKVLGGEEFSKCVLYEKSVGKPNWDIDLQTLTRKKAYVSYKYGMDSHDVQQRYPYLYGPGDNKYAGAINRHGLVVSTAAIEWYFDELFSKMLADTCEALCKKEMEKVMTDANIHFIPSTSTSDVSAINN